MQDPELRGQIQKLDQAMRRLSGAVLVAALFFGAVQFSLADEPRLAWASLAAAGIALIWMLFR